MIFPKDLPKIIEIQPQILDGHIEFAETPLVQVLQWGERDP